MPTIREEGDLLRLWIVFSKFLFPAAIDNDEKTVYILCPQAISEDPDDPVQWHQLGLHSLCTQNFKTSQTYLKAAVARDSECSYTWSNLGIS